MNNSFPILKTERLLLREFVETDMEFVFKGLSHPEIIRYYGVNYSTMEAAREQMIWFKQLLEKGTGIWWAICSSANNVFFGAAGLNDLSKAHQKAEIGYWLMPEYWGKGIITESPPLICNYGFEMLELHRIEAIVETENLRSMRVMERLDFQHEGTLKECEFKNGNFVCVHIYGKLNPAASPIV